MHPSEPGIKLLGGPGDLIHTEQCKSRRDYLGYGALMTGAGN